MTFDQAFHKFYAYIVMYCHQFTKNDTFSSEDITSEAFITLSHKWESLKSHEEPVVLSYLMHTARLKGLEFLRKKPPETIPYEDDYAQNMIAKQMLEDDSIPDAIEEHLKFEAYKTKLRGHLKNPDERKLFKYKVDMQLKNKEIGRKMDLSEGAVKMRWIRLRKKLHPIVEELIKKNL